MKNKNRIKFQSYNVTEKRRKKKLATTTATRSNIRIK